DVLTNDNTITIRVKLVINIKIAGAMDRTVRSNINFTDVETFEGSELEKASINSFMFIILLIIIINHLMPLLLQLIYFLFDCFFKLLFSCLCFICSFIIPFF